MDRARLGSECANDKVNTKSTQNEQLSHASTDRGVKTKENPAGGYAELLMEIQNESAIDVCLLHSFKEGGGMFAK